ASSQVLALSCLHRSHSDDHAPACRPHVQSAYDNYCHSVMETTYQEYRTAHALHPDSPSRSSRRRYRSLLEYQHRVPGGLPHNDPPHTTSRESAAHHHIPATSLQQGHWRSSAGSASQETGKGHSYSNNW